MTGAEFIARVIFTGSLAGIEIGDGLERIDSVVPLSYVDDLTGRGKSRTLRRDYGLFEVSCVGNPDWTCQAMMLEIHRLRHLPDLMGEVREELGIQFDPFTKWADVQREYDLIPGNRVLEVNDETSEYRVFRQRSTGVSVRVVHDSNAGRGEYPGHGDVWGLEIISPIFMP